MPGMAQKQFPREGFRLYDSEREVEALLEANISVRDFALQ
jgi:hypothetical protein